MKLRSVSDWRRKQPERHLEAGAIRNTTSGPRISRFLLPPAVLLQALLRCDRRNVKPRLLMPAYTVDPALILFLDSLLFPPRFVRSLELHRPKKASAQPR